MGAEVLFTYSAAPAKAPEIRPSTSSIELRLAEVPTPEVAANSKLSALELRFFLPEEGEAGWSLFEVWADGREQLHTGGLRATLSEAFAEAAGPFLSACRRRKLGHNGYAWAVLDTWTAVTCIARVATATHDLHVLDGGRELPLTAAFTRGYAALLRLRAQQRG